MISSLGRELNGEVFEDKKKEFINVEAEEKKKYYLEDNPIGSLEVKSEEFTWK